MPGIMLTLARPSKTHTQTMIRDVKAGSEMRLHQSAPVHEFSLLCETQHVDRDKESTCGSAKSPVPDVFAPV